jgi:hypothetical protein
MMHITVALPDEVAQEYYNASEMRFMLAGFAAPDIAAHFDRALRNLTGAPMPDETDTWVFSPGFPCGRNHFQVIASWNGNRKLRSCLRERGKGDFRVKPR